MAGATRELKRRIRSITNTRKVTKAMELVASTKMRRAVQAVLATRSYARRAWELLLNLAERTDVEAHPLLRRGGGNRTGLVLISSNRGLVGAFNAQLIAAAAVYLERIDPLRKGAELVLLGKKGRTMVYRHGYKAIAEFEKRDVVTREEEVRPLAKLVVDEFRKGTFDRVVLAYTDFISALTQKPRIRQLLPLEEDPAIGATVASEAKTPDRTRQSSTLEYLFEPNPDVVLDALLPRLVEMQLFQAVLESNASEHASRMIAMRNASDAAADLIEDLTLSFNQARQAGITQDLAEISASRAALEA